MNKLVVISGCSGGGKSSLLSELNNQGYAVIEEVGRKIVKEYGDLNPLLRCEMIITKSIEVFHQAEKTQLVKENVIFFDRCILEGISYYQTLKIPDANKYDHFIDELRYYPIIFMAPPWKEIFCKDDERKHSFEDATSEYERLMSTYPKYGYHLMELPKIDVKGRIEFILSNIR